MTRTPTILLLALATLGGADAFAQTSGQKPANASAVYVIAGIGSTDFISQKKQTINFGLGMRVLVRDRLSVQVDIRDHVYSLDLLGENTSTNNVEFTAGLSWYF